MTAKKVRLCKWREQFVQCFGSRVLIFQYHPSQRTLHQTSSLLRELIDLTFLVLLASIYPTFLSQVVPRVLHLYHRYKQPSTFFQKVRFREQTSHFLKQKNNAERSNIFHLLDYKMILMSRTFKLLTKNRYQEFILSCEQKTLSSLQYCMYLVYFIGKTAPPPLIISNIFIIYYYYFYFEISSTNRIRHFGLPKL